MKVSVKRISVARQAGRRCWSCSAPARTCWRAMAPARRRTIWQPCRETCPGARPIGLWLPRTPWKARRAGALCSRSPACAKQPWCVSSDHSSEPCLSNVLCALPQQDQAYNLASASRAGLQEELTQQARGWEGFLVMQLAGGRAESAVVTCLMPDNGLCAVRTCRPPVARKPAPAKHAGNEAARVTSRRVWQPDRTRCAPRWLAGERLGGAAAVHAAPAGGARVLRRLPCRPHAERIRSSAALCAPSPALLAFD